MKINLTSAALALLFVTYLFMSCSQTTEVSGGGTVGGNPMVAGVVLDSNNQPVVNARIHLVKIESSYTNVNTTTIEGFSDQEGRYKIALENEGEYGVSISDPSGITGWFDLIQTTSDETISLSDARLYAIKQISIRFPFSLDSGRIRLEGSDFETNMSGGDSSVNMKLPPGSRGRLLYKPAGDGKTFVLPGKIDTVKTQTRQLQFNPIDTEKVVEILLVTTPDGAGTEEDVADFPVAVRLDSVIFHQMNYDTNLVFINEKGRVLPHEIESWNPENSVSVWVLADTVWGNDTTSMFLYWGEEFYPGLKPSQPVFDTANGFISVFHLNDEQPLVKVKDATPSQNHGMRSTGFEPSTWVNGIFGGAQKFGETPARLQAPTPGIPNGVWSLSVWFKPLEPINQSAITGDLPGSVRISWGADQELLSRVKMHLDYSEPPDFLTMGPKEIDLSWHHAAMVCDTAAKTCEFIVDGDSVNVLTWNEGTVSTFQPGLRIGGNYITDYQGLIDEVRLSKVKRTRAWVKLSYENQKQNQSLVRLKL